MEGVVVGWEGMGKGFTSGCWQSWLGGVINSAVCRGIRIIVIAVAVAVSDDAVPRPFRGTMIVQGTIPPAAALVADRW